MYRVRVVVTDRGPRLVTTRGLERMEQGKPLQWQPGWGRRDAVVVAAQYELRFEAQYGDGPADTAPPESTADGVLVPVAVRELYRQFSDPLWNPAADGLRPRNEDHGLRYWEGRLPIARLAAATVTVRRLEPAADPGFGASVGRDAGRDSSRGGVARAVTGRAAARSLLRLTAGRRWL
jgi:hypothetical protein